MFKEIIKKVKNFDIKPKPPKSLTELNEKAKVSIKRGRFAEAAELYRKLVLLFPNNYNCLDNYIEYFSFTPPRIALETAKTLLEKHPDEVRLLNIIALSSRDDDESREYHSRIVQLNPNSESSKYFVNILNGRKPKSPPSTYVRGLFDCYAAYFDHHLEYCLGYSTPGTMAELLKKQHNKKIPFNNVLDACCGTGLFGKQLRINFKVKKLTGVDISSCMIEQAKKKHIYNDLKTSEIISFLEQAQPAQYDLISAIDAVSYIGALDNFFELIHKALTNDGLFCFTTEISTQEDYIASRTGRFLHSKKYIKELAKDKFTIMKFKKDSSRAECGKVEDCYYIILMKN